MSYVIDVVSKDIMLSIVWKNGPVNAKAVSVESTMSEIVLKHASNVVL